MTEYQIWFLIRLRFLTGFSLMWLVFNPLVQEESPGIFQRLKSNCPSALETDTKLYEGLLFNNSEPHKHANQLHAQKLLITELFMHLSSTVFCSPAPSWKRMARIAACITALPCPCRQLCIQGWTPEQHDSEFHQPLKTNLKACYYHIGLVY